MTDALPSNRPGPTTLTSCANCASRPGDRPTYFHETTVRYSSPFLFGAGWFHKTTQSGSVVLCERCAHSYGRMVALRESGNRLMNRSVLILILGGIGYVLASLMFPVLFQAPLNLVFAGLALATTLALVLGLMFVLTARVLKGPATRFLR